MFTNNLIFLKDLLSRYKVNPYISSVFFYLMNSSLERNIPTLFVNYLFRNLVNYGKIFYFRYRVKLRLKGNGFYLKADQITIFLYGGQSHLFEFLLPSNIQAEVKGRKKRFLLLVSTDRTKLMNFASYIQKFVYPDIYRHKGLRFVKQKLRQKEGKKKFV